MSTSSFRHFVINWRNQSPLVTWEVERPKIIKFQAVVTFATKHVHWPTRNTSWVTGPWARPCWFIGKLDLCPNICLQVVNCGLVTALTFLKTSKYNHRAVSFIKNCTVLITRQDNIAASLDLIPGKSLHIKWVKWSKILFIIGVNLNGLCIIVTAEEEHLLLVDNWGVVGDWSRTVLFLALLWNLAPHAWMSIFDFFGLEIT